MTEGWGQDEKATNEGFWKTARPSNMDATLHQLAARGLEISGSPVQGLDHNWQYWLTDPDGNRIELMQVMPDSPQAAVDARWSEKARSSMCAEGAAV